MDSGIAMVLEEIKGTFLKEMFERKKYIYIWCNQSNQMYWILKPGLKSGVGNDLFV